MDADEQTALRAQIAALTAAVEALTGARVAKKSPSATVEQVASAYLAEKRGSRSWRMRYDKLAPLRRRLGSLPAIELTPKVWALHRGARRLEVMDYGRSRDKAPAEASLNVELGVAKAMLEWASSDEQETLPFNPLRKAKRVKTKKARKTWLREDDLQRLLEAPEPRGEEQRAAFRAFVLIKADTGLRFSEVISLRRDRIRETETGTVIDVDRTKGDKGHKVGLTPRDVEAIGALPASLRSPYLFTRPATQKRYGHRTVYGWFREACRSSGLDEIVVDGEIRVRPHDLRRSAATNVVNRGGTLQDAQVMLNHSNISTTALYVQQTDTSALQIAAIMADPKDRPRRGPQRSTETGMASHVSVSVK